MRVGKKEIKETFNAHVSWHDSFKNPVKLPLGMPKLHFYDTVVP